MSNIGREHIIEVPGLPAGLQSTAKEDIGRLLDAIARVADKQGKQFLLDKVRVSDRFEDDVNRLLDERSGLSNYLKMARRHCRRNHRSAHASCNTPR